MAFIKRKGMDRNDGVYRGEVEEPLVTWKDIRKGIRKAIHKQVDGEINVQDLLNSANNYYLNNNYQEAKEVLETIISVSPYARFRQTYAPG